MRCFTLKWPAAVLRILLNFPSFEAQPQQPRRQELLVAARGCLLRQTLGRTSAVLAPGAALDLARGM